MRAVLIYTIVAIAGGLAISALGQEKSRGKGKPSAVAKAPAESAEAAEEDWNIPVTLGKDGWMIYENPRFGFSLPVPPNMKTTRPPDNGGDQQFISLDDKVSLTVW